LRSVWEKVCETHISTNKLGVVVYTAIPAMTEACVGEVQLKAKLSQGKQKPPNNTTPYMKNN
jgi:hypothetical protein